jgi:hypothetical protein
MNLDQLAALFNGRANAVRREQAMYRNVYGDIFELYVNLDKQTIKAYALGGTIVGFLEYPDGIDGVDVPYDIELTTRNWTRGYVPCSDCGVLLTRFSDDIAGRYMSGVYCKTCWPRYEAMKTREVD